MQSQPDGSHSASNLRAYEYERKMGAYRPHFEGIPDEYYPLNAKEVFFYTIFVLGIIGGMLGVMIGLIYWVLNDGLEHYTIVWCVIWLAFAVFLIIIFYWGGKNRIKEEKRLIVEQQKKQEELRGKPKEAPRNQQEIDI